MKPEDDRKLLRALCRRESAAAARRAAERLRGHAWASGEHQIIFEACARLARRGTQICKENVAREVTLAGFPDVDLDALFEPGELTGDGSPRKAESARRRGKSR